LKRIIQKKRKKELDVNTPQSKREFKKSKIKENPVQNAVLSEQIAACGSLHCHLNLHLEETPLLIYTL